MQERAGTQTHRNSLTSKLAFGNPVQFGVESAEQGISG
jgi:hypothetical protein